MAFSDGHPYVANVLTTGGLCSGGAMGAVGGPSDNPLTMNPMINRHGSVEQSAPGQSGGTMGDMLHSYLNSVNNTGNTPRPRSPRSAAPRSRARSPVHEDDDYEDRRSERRERRQGEDHEPIGLRFKAHANNPYESINLNLPLSASWSTSSPTR